MKRSDLFSIAFAALAVSAVPNLVWAQNQPKGTTQQSRIRQVSGKVVSLGDDDFVLNTGKAKVLVDAEERPLQQAKLSVGEQITVTGRYDDDNFDAHTITRSNGTSISVRDD